MRRTFRPERHFTTWNATCNFAELGIPTLEFYDRMGGERLFDDRGQLGGAYAWRDVSTLIT